MPSVELTLRIQGTAPSDERRLIRCRQAWCRSDLGSADAPLSARRHPAATLMMPSAVPAMTSPAQWTPSVYVDIVTITPSGIIVMRKPTR